MKKISISVKWATLIGVVVLAVLIGGLIINKLFFYSYFLSNEKEVIFSYAKEIEDAYNNDRDKLEEKIKVFTLKKSVNIFITETEYLFKHSTYGMGNSMIKGKQRVISTTMDFPIEYREELLREGYSFFLVSPEWYSVNLLVLAYNLNETETVVITLPFENIGKTADIAMKFNFMVSLVLLIFAVLIVLVISKKMTKPIINLSMMTKRIANLDFSETFKVSTGDEIGELGQNINSMSVALEQSLSELQLANEALLYDIQEKDKHVEMRKSLIANISHELKTPISLVMSYTEGLIENYDLDKDKKDYYLGVISKESKHMDLLVRDLLNLSELEFDAFRLKKSSLDLSSLIDEILDRYIMMISKKKLSVKIDKEDILMLQADRKRLEQALTNLIINGIEHANEGGQLLINVKNLEDVYEVVIENTGSHIAEDQLHMIWSSFYKSESNKERRIGGSGIGLSIVRAVIDKHEGSYKAENIENGVRFTIQLKK